MIKTPHSLRGFLTGAFRLLFSAYCFLPSTFFLLPAAFCFFTWDHLEIAIKLNFSYK